MEHTQALVNVLIRQRNDAMNRLADLEAQLMVLRAEENMDENAPSED